MRVLKLRGEPFEVGHQHGRQIAELIRGFYGFCHMMLRDIPQEKTKKTLWTVEQATEANYPDAAAEMRGLAKGAGMGYEQVLTMNFTSEVRASHTQGCTAFAAVKEATRAQNPLTGKTRDMASQVYHPFQVALDLKVKGKPHIFLAEAFSGMAVTGCGMNQYGLALNLNIIPRITDADETLGIQRAFLARKVLEESRDTDEAVKIISQTHLCYQGANFMLCDREGNAAVVEKSHCHQEVRWPENRILAMANHYADPDMSRFEIFEAKTSPIRMKRMIEMLESSYGKVDLNVAKRFLKDHEGDRELSSICRHVPEGVNTVSAYVLAPKKREIHLADGHPCERRFTLYSPFG